MKSKSEVLEKFNALVVQRDSCTQGSAARHMLNQRALALAWVLDHEQAIDLLLSDDAISIFDVLG